MNVKIDRDFSPLYVFASAMLFVAALVVLAFVVAGLKTAQRVEQVQTEECAAKCDGDRSRLAGGWGACLCIDGAGHERVAR